MDVAKGLGFVGQVSYIWNYSRGVGARVFKLDEGMQTLYTKKFCSFIIIFLIIIHELSFFHLKFTQF